MTKEEFGREGLKLLGVYFVAQALTSLGWVLVQVMPLFISRGGHIDGDLLRGLFYFALQPGLSFLVGYILLRRTGWCLRTLDR